jgi:hypothetical protein
MVKVTQKNKRTSFDLLIHHNNFFPWNIHHNNICCPTTIPRRQRFLVAFIVLVVFGTAFLLPESRLLDGSSVTKDDSSNLKNEWWWISQRQKLHFLQQTAPDMTIIILSMDRFTSLERLISSLMTSNYENNTIDLVVRFDRPLTALVDHRQWMQQVNQLRDSLLLQWPHGNTRIAIATETLGLAESWFRAWTPSSDTDRAVIFEDDLEVSPLWYQWLKGAHDAYASTRPDLAAFSLSHQELVPLKTSKRSTKEFPTDQPFLYALLGSHGFSPLAKIWTEFLEFVRCTKHRSKFSIATPELITSDWYYNMVRKESMWTQHFIFFTKQRNLYNIYQFPKDKTLAAHWQEKGAHFNGHTRGRNFPLIQEGDMAMTFPSNLKKYDWGANLVRDSDGTQQQLPYMVMSAAIGYKLDRFKSFVGSLRHVFAGDVWLLISNDASSEIRTYLQQQDVKTVETKGGLAKHASKEWERINRSRFSFFVSVCNATMYSLCLTSDFRDSLFQGDPFFGIDLAKLQPDAPSVLFLYEHNTVMNDYHYDLMRSKSCGLYNDYARFLRNTKIINGGSMIGSPIAFQLLEYYMTKKWGGCNDQVTLNVLARTDALLLHNITTEIYRQGEGCVNVLGWGGEVIRDSTGKFLNLNCMLSPVVHQYDLV